MLDNKTKAYLAISIDIASTVSSILKNNLNSFLENIKFSELCMLNAFLYTQEEQIEFKIGNCFLSIEKNKTVDLSLTTSVEYYSDRYSNLEIQEFLNISAIQIPTNLTPHIENEQKKVFLKVLNNNIYALNLHLLDRSARSLLTDIFFSKGTLTDFDFSIVDENQFFYLIKISCFIFGDCKINNIVKFTKDYITPYQSEFTSIWQGNESYGDAFTSALDWILLNKIEYLCTTEGSLRPTSSLHSKIKDFILNG